MNSFSETRVKFAQTPPIEETQTNYRIKKKFIDRKQKASLKVNQLLNYRQKWRENLSENVFLYTNWGQSE